MSSSDYFTPNKQMYGQLNAKRQEAVQLWFNAENDEEKMDACNLMQQCKGDDIECLLILSQWFSELEMMDQALECYREGAEVWSDIKCITSLVRHFKGIPEGEEEYSHYLQQGANLKEPLLICEFAHYLQHKAQMTNASGRSGNDDVADGVDAEDLLIWTEKAASLQDGLSLRLLAEWSKQEQMDKTVSAENRDGANLDLEEEEAKFGPTLSLYLKAAKAGNLESYIIAASMLLQGVQCKPDSKLAVEMLVKAARFTCQWSKMVAIGQCLANGDVVAEQTLPQDPEAAFGLFEEAAMNGDLDARFMMAECLFRGVGVQEDRIEAEENYQDLLDLGMVIAIPGLARCKLAQGGRDEAKRLLRRFFTQLVTESSDHGLQLGGIVITEESLEAVLDEL